MITKKINKSSELIFVGPNYLKLSDSKPIIKKSMHFVSPKSSSKPIIKTVYKPHTSSRKGKQIKYSNCQEYNSKPGVSFGSPSQTMNAKMKYNTSSKRSKSKLTVHQHMSTDLWRSSVYESLNSKPTSSTHRRPQSIEFNPKSEEKQTAKDNDQKYEKIIHKTNQTLKKYTSVILKLSDEVAALKEENLLLKKKLKII